MKVKFYGVRGSYPTSSQANIYTGGNTSCVLIETSDGKIIILDAGTGIKNLGLDLFKREFKSGSGEAHILLTHTMWDHIEGIPFFKPFYIEGNRFTVYCGRQNDTNIKSILEGQQENIYFPVPFSQLNAIINFVEISESQEFYIGKAKINTVRLNHPENTLGFRIEDSGKVITYITDTAPYKTLLLSRMLKEEAKDNEAKYIKKRHEDLIKANMNSDFMIFDAHFTPEGIKNKEHWGHSTWEYAVEIALAAKVKALGLFHHAPENDDEIVNSIFFQLKKMKFPFKILSCKEKLALSF